MPDARSRAERRDAEHPGGGRAPWRSVARWRDWRLPVKLAAVLAVPVLVAVVAGALQIQAYVARSESYTRMQSLVGLRAELIPLVAGVQRERTLAARRGAGGVIADPLAFDDQRHASEAQTKRTLAAHDRTVGLGEVSASRFAEVLRRLDRLVDLRAQVSGATIDAPAAISAYTSAVEALLDFDQALVSQFADTLLSGTALALHHVEVAKEQVTLQHAVVVVGLARGKLLSQEVRTLTESELRLGDRRSDFQAVATRDQRADYDAAVSGADIESRDRFVQYSIARESQVLLGEATAPLVNAGEWDRTSEATTARMAEVAAGLAAELRGTADRLQDETSDKAGLVSVLLLATLAAAIAIGSIVGRHLLGSLAALRRAALEVADERLPAAVEGIRAGEEPEAIEPVPVHTRDEFGQLARAFDAVHEQAVRSAVEQAGLRGNMRDIFVNLSRRSQGLVERQLKLMEELERKEEDPDQLANLFKLDHLATRMRRNNENLMVLSGTEVVRRFTRAVPLADALRAAVSEIEQYQRVVVQSAPPIEVVGYAAGDLVRLVAELLDNAAAFSPPRTQVLVGARAEPDGSLLIEILDRGIGMGEAELARVNEQLAAEGDIEVPVSRQMGLSVVGRLAHRHGVRVWLRPAGPGLDGVRASILVPAELVGRMATPPPLPPSPPPPPSLPPVPDTPRTPDGITDTGSSWFAPEPAAQAGRPAAPELGSTAVGLPKRPPRGNLAADLTQPPPPPTRDRPVRRDPDRVRGFLASYQSGARRGARPPEPREEMR